MCTVDDHVIYGLLAGMETVIDEHFEIEPITKEQFAEVMDVLDPYYKDKKERDKLKGFNHIEYELDARGVPSWTAKKILTYLKSNGQYELEINNLESCGDSYEIDEWYK